MLEEEEENELKRQKLLRSVDDQIERNRLEKILGVERAQTEYKLMQLAQKHDHELQKL